MATIEVSNHLDAPIRKLFGDFEYTADNWYYAPWFGYFYANSWPWILSLSHGWLKVEEEQSEAAECLHVFDFKLGAWSTSAGDYPQIKRGDGSKLRYITTEGETRTFEDGLGNAVQLPLSNDDNKS